MSNGRSVLRTWMNIQSRYGKFLGFTSHLNVHAF